MKKTKVDKKIFLKNKEWSFSKKIAPLFDNHIYKSVPLYHQLHWLCEQLSDFYIKEDSIVYDIGCSTGALLNKIAKRQKEKKKVKYFGFDIVKKMIEFAKVKNSYKHIKYIIKNIINYKLNKSDFITCFYTLPSCTL